MNDTDPHDIRRRLLRLVSDLCGFRPELIAFDAPLRSFGFDSFRAYELTVLVEDTFGHKLGPAALEKIETLDDLAARLEELEVAASEQAQVK